jgi:mRNA interferase MazF
MIDFEFGDVVLVPFPFTNQASIKKRPAVVVSSATHHRARLDIIILAITSQIQAPSQMGTFLVKDWKAAGLLKPSVMKPILTTLQKTLVQKKLGHFVRQDLQSLHKVLQDIFGDLS